MPAWLLILAALLCATVSGLFGMGGGMIFLGLIAAWLSVAAAMVVHGVVQSASNGSRAWFLRAHVRWDVVRWEGVGAVPVVALLLAVSFVPDTPTLYILLGLLPLLLWLPKRVFALDAARPRDAVLCGGTVAGLNLSAGVAGPALDFFYVRTALTRREIVATKAVTMFGAHLVKILYFGVPLVRAQGLDTLPAPWALGVAAGATFAGSWLGTRGLALFSDVGFRRVSRWLVTGVGAVYLWRGAALL